MTRLSCTAQIKPQVLRHTLRYASESEAPQLCNLNPMPNRRLATIALIVLSSSLCGAHAADAQHELKWDSLMKLDGKYLQDKAATTMLTPSLKKLLGGKYPEFMGSIKVQTPMEIENGLLIVRGMMPHSGGDRASLAFFSMSSEMSRSRGHATALLIALRRMFGG